MRIAILTFHRAYNCGAVLQAWALQTVIERMGHRVFFPKMNDVGVLFYGPKFYRRSAVGKIRNFCGWLYALWCNRYYDLRRHLAYGLFCKRHLHCSNDRSITTDNADLVLVGSDQVWNPNCAGEKYLPIFLGESVDRRIPMVAYAASGGDGSMDHDTVTRILSTAANRFRSISFREPFICGDMIMPGDIVCDPTLLLSQADFRSVELKRKSKDKFLFAYVVSDAKEAVPVIRKIAQMMKIKSVIANAYCGPNDDVNIHGDIDVLTPDKMLSYIRDAEYVIVTSFHGCAISLQYHKNFVCLYAPKSTVGRQQFLLSKLQIEDRRLSVETDAGIIIDKLNETYDVTNLLAVIRQKSLAWIENALRA